MRLGPTDTLSRSDEEILTLFALSGEADHFRAVVKRFSARMYSVSFALLGKTDEAEDAVQEALLKIHRARRYYQNHLRAAPWIFTILRNHCLDCLRKRKRCPESRLELFEPSTEETPLRLLEQGEQARLISEGFNALAPLDREILTLRLIEEMDFAGIAACCGLSLEATKKRAYRAMEILRAALTGQI
ncbi:MAG: hypothetical protein A2293_13955 [Elusimicrobia bacterium RIFOXYB2_FULL_49_7]|nr:MAG: hypothetical protein A2293_13955 [Elusimicrobia bacterium RIFOXYB2_FULL_49_7]